MGEHDKGQRGEAGGAMAPDQPSTQGQQQGANPRGKAQDQAPTPPGAPQGVFTGGPQAGMAGPYPGVPGPVGYAGQPGFVAPGMHPGVAPHPAAYGLPPGVDPYWAYHAQQQAASAPPPYPYAGPYFGMAPPQATWPGYAPGLEPQGGAGRMGGGGHGAGQGAGHGAGMAELVDEIANGGNGLSSLGKMLNFDDSEFWKGALLGAAVVLVLTNESVQGALFKTGAKTKAAVKTGVDRVKERVQKSSDASTRETNDV
jgi:hypothetical protein